MQKILLLSLIFLLISCQSSQKQEITTEDKSTYGIVIHGGAGGMQKGVLPDSVEVAYHQKLQEAVNAGYSILEKGGSSTDAVIVAITILEDSPLFNAGKGAVLTHEGNNELDASIMNGTNREAGAVAGVKRIKNPIRAALAVMDQSPHVLLSGDGADAFAATVGLDTVNPSYFFTQKRYESLQRAISKEKHGTVGAVCLDQMGNLAAGTSTGGMTNKRYGRIGDSPIIGAGTYADENCAVSCTGHGEYFIRYAVAYDVAAQIRYGGKSLAGATKSIIYEKLKKAGGEGGLISIDKKGNISMPFNTSGMFRAFRTSKNTAQSFIYPTEAQ